jgi:hypothetical protein
MVKQGHLERTGLRACPGQRHERARRPRVAAAPPLCPAYSGGYQDRLLGGPLGLLNLCGTTPDGVDCKDYGRVVLG